MNSLIPGHQYQLENFDKECAEQTPQFLQFIQKEKSDTGELVTVKQGTTNEDVLAVLIHRLNFLNSKFPCRENSIAITHIETALLWLNKRTADRVARGVEGKAAK